MAETNDGHTFYDKQFMAGDPRAGHNEAYITFTVFVADQKCSSGNNPGAFCSSEIFYSKWDGTKWSTPTNLSGSSASLCNFGDTFDKKADPHACNFNQGSMPVVSPADGSVFVVWNNGNTATLLNQQLGRKINADGRWARSSRSVRTRSRMSRSATSAAGLRSASSHSTSGRTTSRPWLSIRQTPIIW